MTVKIFFTADDSWLSKGIKFFEAMQTGDAQWSQESTKGRVRSRAWPLEGKDLQIRTIQLFMTVAQEAALKQRCLIEIGKFTSIYGFSKMPLLIADSLLSKMCKKPTFLFTKR